MNASEFLKTSLPIFGQKSTAVDRPLPVKPSGRNMTLRQAIASFSHLPPQTAILGVCEDGLPVLLDLTDDRPGPLMVCGDDGVGKTDLMQALVQTAISLNSSNEVKYSVIASAPEQWAALDGARTRDRHCFGFASAYSDEAGGVIMKLAEIAEQRRTGRGNGPAILLVIDDLQFMARADFDVRLNFEWLLKNGPSLQVWPVVSLPTQAALDMSRMVTYFHTRLIGHMESSPGNRLSLYDGLDAENLEPGKQFAVRVDDQWLNFWLPARD